MALRPRATACHGTHCPGAAWPVSSQDADSPALQTCAPPHRDTGTHSLGGETRAVGASSVTGLALGTLGLPPS